MVAAPSRLAKISFWAKTANLSAIQYNAELRTLKFPRVCAKQNSTASSAEQHDAAAAHRGDGEGCAVWMSMGSRRLSWWPLTMNATQDWTYFEYTAPTWTEPVGIFLGIEDRGTPQARELLI